VAVAALEDFVLLVTLTCPDDVSAREVKAVVEVGANQRATVKIVRGFGSLACRWDVSCVWHGETTSGLMRVAAWFRHTMPGREGQPDLSGWVMATPAEDVVVEEWPARWQIGLMGSWWRTTDSTGVHVARDGVIGIYQPHLAGHLPDGFVVVGE